MKQRRRFTKKSSGQKRDWSRFIPMWGTNSRRKFAIRLTDFWIGVYSSQRAPESQRLSAHQAAKPQRRFAKNLCRTTWKVRGEKQKTTRRVKGSKGQRGSKGCVFPLLCPFVSLFLCVEKALFTTTFQVVCRNKWRQRPGALCASHGAPGRYRSRYRTCATFLQPTSRCVARSAAK